MKKKVKQVLTEFCNNSCTAEELKFLKEYLESDDLNELEEILKNDWIQASTSEGFDFIKENEIWLKIKEIIEKEKTMPVEKRARRNKRRPVFLRYAAVFVGIIAISVGYYTYTNTEDSKEITITLDDGTKKIIEVTKEKKTITNVKGKFVATLHDKLVYKKEDNLSFEESEELVYNTLYVPYGKKFGVVLSDGSEVYLNSGSTLKYPVKFIEGQSREVFLDGEAYFTIAKHNEDSFLVNANNIVSRVYGTQFNVSSYANEAYTQVVLIEGSVGVSSRGMSSEFMLKPNEIAKYIKSDNTLVTNTVDVSSHVAWIDGVLLFKNENFNNILRKLERHYDLRITNNSNLIDDKFTGRFETEKIEEVLNTFKKITSFNYTKRGKKIIINP